VKFQAGVPLFGRPSDWARPLCATGARSLAFSAGGDDGRRSPEHLTQLALKPIRVGGATSSALLVVSQTMLASTVKLPSGRPPSPQIRARNTSLDGTTNGSAGVSAPNVDAGVNSATHLGGQRCGDHEDPGDSAKYRKLANHKAAYLPNTRSTAFMTGTLKFFSSLQ
jgi:hypothetical protein